MKSISNQIITNIRRGYYKYIGSGSCRKVYDLDNGYVVKVAKNRAGIAQNKAEYTISRHDYSNLFAKVTQVSNDFKFLIMEKAEKINDISYVWDYFNVSNKRELFNIDELQKIKKDYNLILGDFGKTSSWGTINGRPVIIDYGFTINVRNKYYN